MRVDSLAISIESIYELSKGLTDSSKQALTALDFAGMRVFRNRIAHTYDKIPPVEIVRLAKQISSQKCIEAIRNRAIYCKQNARGTF